MSLEAAIINLTEAVNEQNAKLDIMLGRAGASASNSDAGKDETETKPKRTRASAKKEEKDESGNDEAPEHTVDSVKKLAGAWLGEYAKDENDPETQARKDKLKATIASLAKKEGFEAADAKKGVLLTDVPAEHLSRVVAWLEKQPTVDNGFGAGRLTEVPGDEKSEENEDDI